MKEQEIVIFQADDGSVSVDVKLHNESLWLSLNQLADLFMRDKSVIAKHLKNIFSEEELHIEGTVANFATVQTEGNRMVERQTEHYNLDAIISVGYRVNSKRGTQFRRWSSNILKEHLMQGYTINKEKISEDSLKQLKFTVDLLSNTLLNQNLVTREGMDVIALIQKYAKTWDILLRFDENRLDSDNKIHSSVDAVELSYQNSIIAINELRRELEKRNEATHLFGKERENSLSGILGNVFQTFALLYNKGSSFY
jgi:DNA ligase (NAD+)